MTIVSRITWETTCVLEIVQMLAQFVKKKKKANTYDNL